MTTDDLKNAIDGAREGFDAVAVRLAALSRADYRKKRDDEAEALGVEPRELDAAVNKAKAERPQTRRPGNGANGSDASGEIPYRMDEKSGTYWRQPTKDGPVEKKLANFCASIVAEVERDDGVERSKELEIEARLKGSTRRFVVPSARFNSLNWVMDHVGAGAIIEPGQGMRDRCLHAILTLSNAAGPIPSNTIRTHSGWATLSSGQWVYLHAGGALGADGAVDGISTELADNLANIQLPDKPSHGELREAVEAVRGLLRVAPLRIIAPLLAAVARAVLGPVDSVVWLLGPSGAFKSELAALFQGFYGAGFTRTNLPAGWNDTANRIEAIAFLAKDALIVVDDFAPGNSQAENQELRRAAARVLRAVGNQAGRGKLHSDSSLRPTRHPRGLVLVTGEEGPSGHSIQARTFLIEVKPGEIDRDRLTVAQESRDLGLFARVTSALICELARDLEGYRKRHRVRVRELTRAAASGQHARTPHQLAELGAALELLFVVLEQLGAIDQGDADHVWQPCWAALNEVAGDQAALQADQNPAEKFLSLLSSAIMSRSAHLGRVDRPDSPPTKAESFGWRRDSSERWQPGGRQIGWTDGVHAFLEPDAVFQLVSQQAGQAGTAIGLGPRTLWKRLDEAGALAITDPGRQTHRRRIGDSRPHTVVISCTRLRLIDELGEAPEADEQEPAAPPASAEEIEFAHQALLEDVMNLFVFRRVDALSGEEICNALRSAPGQRWGALGVLMPPILKAALAAFGVENQQLWQAGNSNRRRYLRKDVEYAFQRAFGCVSDDRDDEVSDD
jgi:hypothetical protein